MNSVNTIDVPEFKTREDVRKFIQKQLENPQCVFALSIKLPEGGYKSVSIKKIVEDVGLDAVVDFIYETLSEKKANFSAFDMDDIIRKANDDPDSLTEEEISVLNAVTGGGNDLYEEAIMNTVNVFMTSLYAYKDDVFKTTAISMGCIIKFLKNMFLFTFMKDKNFIYDAEGLGLYNIFKDGIITKLKAGESSDLDNKSIFIGLVEWMFDILDEDTEIAQTEVDYDTIIDTTGLNREIITSIRDRAADKKVAESKKEGSNVTDIRSRLKRNT